MAEFDALLEDNRRDPRAVRQRILTEALAEALSEVVARLIWQASAGHGGINYPQWQFFSVVPNAPGAAYASEGSLMEALPKLRQAAFQVDIINVLTQNVIGRLGEYDTDFTKKLNPMATSAVANFVSSLAQLNKDVDARNKTVPRAFTPYGFLSPEHLPQSTNI